MMRLIYTDHRYKAIIIGKSNRKREEGNMDLNIFKDTPPWEWPEDAADDLFRGTSR